MELTINSKTLGKEFTFNMRDEGGYIRLWDDNKKEYRQICEGGSFMGSTLTGPADEGRFKKICKNWYRAHLAREKELMVEM